MNHAFGFASVALLCFTACSSGSSSPGSSSAGSTSSSSAGSAGKTGASGATGTSGASGALGTSGAGTGAGGTGNGTGASGAGGSSTVTAGSGGALASAGSAGSAGSGTGTGCSGLALCDDFEAGAVGTAPTGWTLFNGFGCSGANGATTPKYPAVIDTAQFHSGSKSVKVSGGDSCGPLLVNTAGFPKLSGGEVYGRFYVRMPSVTAFDHTVLAALGLQGGVGTAASFDQANNLALAPEQIGNSAALVWQTTDSNILPAKAPAAASQTTFPKADTWTCVEFHLSANSKAIETWIDGAVVPGMTFIPGTTAVNQEVNGQWTPAALSPTALGLGWLVFSGPSISLWFDDVALGASRIGCN